MSEELIQFIELDVLGERCPIPVQRIRRAIKNRNNEESLIVTGDDPESLHDIPILLSRLGLEPAVIEELEDAWRYTIRLS